MKRYFLVLSCFISIVSCSKKNDVPSLPNGYVLIPQEVKDYFVYYPGSYWVYQDSLSGATDSVKVTSTITYEASHNKGSYGEGFFIYKSSSFYKDSSYIEITYYGGEPLIKDLVQVNNIRVLYSQPPYPDSGSWQYNSSQNHLDTTIYYYPFKTLNQNNQTISYVAKTYDTNLFEYTVNGHCPRGCLYFKDHLFIVRKEIKGDGIIPNRVWILKQSHIVQ